MASLIRAIDSLRGFDSGGFERSQSSVSSTYQFYFHQIRNTYHLSVGETKESGVVEYPSFLEVEVETLSPVDHPYIRV